MKKYFDIIKASTIFSGIDENEIESMLVCLNAKEGSYRKGDYLLRTGDSAEEIGLLLYGSVLVIQEDFWGNRNLMSRIVPGQVFAEAFACSPGSVLNVSVTSDEASSVLWLNVRRILTSCPTACSHHSRMIRNLLSDIASKNLRFNEKLTHMCQRTTRDKLMSYLSAEAQRRGISEFDIPFNRQQLADYLSVDRSAMSSALCRLRDDGTLDFDKNHFVLHLCSGGNASE